jgi:hypothetical protein
VRDSGRGERRSRLTVGDAGVVVPSLDLEPWSDALSGVTDDALRRRLIRAGLDRVSGRVWRDCAPRSVEVDGEATS